MYQNFVSKTSIDQKKKERKEYLKQKLHQVSKEENDIDLCKVFPMRHFSVFLNHKPRLQLKRIGFSSACKHSAIN